MKGITRCRPALFAVILFLLGAATDPFPEPVAVVYPFIASGQLAPDAGSTVAVLLSTRMIQLGGITVKPYTPGTDRSEYLDAALKQDADYYVTGYLTPVGDDVSLIAQVVSTHSGSIVYSTTMLVRTFGDVAGQADEIRDAIVRHAGRSYAALDEPEPAPSGSPRPRATGGIDLSHAFSHRTHGTAQLPSPAPRVAEAPVASSPALILTVDGVSDARAQAYAASAIAKYLKRDGVDSGMLPVSAAAGVVHAAQLCAANAGARLLYAGTLSIDPGGNRAPSDVQFQVSAYDCKGTLLGRAVGTATVGKRGVDGAIDAAADSAVAATLKAAAAS